MTLSIHLLGRFEIRLDGLQLDSFSTDKVRALLAFLAVEYAHAHRREKLATLFWPDQTDERARQSLRQALTSLKQGLGDNKYLVITPQAIQINLSSDMLIDTHIFALMANECEHHSHRNLFTCYPCLQRQIKLAALYDDEFLKGFPSLSSEPFEEWLLLTRESMHQIAMQAVMLLADYYQRRGELETAMRFLRQQLAWIPWHEEGYRKLMCLLAGSGNRTAAMTEYERCKNALEREFCVGPTRETIQLYEEIKKNEYPISTFPSKNFSTNTTFIGREDELSRISDLLSNPACRLLTILGPGGSGKTRLAMQIIERHTGLYRDGVFYVALLSTESCMDALQEMIMAMGIDPEPDPVIQLNDLLKNKQILFMLDNFEHLIDGCEFLSNLLQHAPDVQILITSRERLFLVEEWTFGIEGLNYPQNDDPIDEKEYDAINLFLHRATQVNNNYAITAEQMPCIVEICQLVEGFPLGIELAASTMFEQSCTQIAQALSENLAAINSPLRNIPARHQNLRVAFEHSWNLLPEQEQEALANLSIFSGSFTTDAAQQISNVSTDQLKSLVRRSLLRFTVEGRYEFHEIIHQFASEKCVQSEAIRAAHANYFAAFIDRFNNPSCTEARQDFQLSRANILSAWRWSLKHGNHDCVKKILPAIFTIFTMIGPMTEGETMLKSAINLVSNDADQELVNHLYLALGRLYKEIFKIDEAIQSAQQIIDSNHGSMFTAQAYLLIGQSYIIKGEGSQASPALQKALELSREINDPQLELDILSELGRAAFRAYDHDGSIQYCQQALKLSRKLNDQTSEGLSHNTIGTEYYFSGRLIEAEQNFQLALDIFRALGDGRNEARALINLSNIAADNGDLSGSLHIAKQAFKIHSEMKNTRGKGVVLQSMGATLWQLGCYEESREIYEQALALYRMINMPHAEAEILANLCLLEGVLGNYTKARNYANLSIAFSKDTNNLYNLANTYQFIGRMELQAGNYEAAQSALDMALETSTESHDSGRYLEILTELAYLTYCKGDSKSALEKCELSIEAIFTNGLFEGADEPIRIYYLAWKIALSNDDPRAVGIIQKAIKLLNQRANLIAEPKYQQSYLENVASHRDLISAYKTQGDQTK